jgi:UDP-N-acetylmuramoyl-L-alanyl-D-glutamate--2,6-diaminopimelate ligase
MAAVSLNRLLSAAGLPEVAEQTISGVSIDSRTVTPGGLFMALAGAQAHGLDYLESALDRGARVVLWEPAESVGESLVDKRCQRTGARAIRVPELRRLAGEVAAAFYADPGRALAPIAVTGTDGKTSVSCYAAQLLEAANEPAAVIGTLGWGRPTALAEAGLTTPDAVTLQGQLAELRRSGFERVVMEASSHALAQYRLDAAAIETAVLTHVGRDHLDYHGSLAAYRQAKARLFGLPTLRRRVLNLDDPTGRSLARVADAPGVCLTYGSSAEADLRLADVTARPDGLSCRIEGRQQTFDVDLPLLGRFNAMNALAALAAVAGADVDARWCDALSQLAPVPGRMERFTAVNGPLVVVDYAHTPGALAGALQTLAEHATGRLICVFGCGGDRDPGKRPLMGTVAARFADRLVLTNDNPRTESPQAIIAGIREGIPADKPCEVKLDRAEAIAAALDEAGRDDVVLVAGKGHESTQQVGDQMLPFSDRDEVRDRLAGRACA